MEKEIILLILIIGFANYSVYAEEGTYLRLVYIAFIPFSVDESPYLFEEASYEHVGEANVKVFDFNRTRKKEVVFKLRELLEKAYGRDRYKLEGQENASQINFVLKGSYFGSEDMREYVFHLYPDFLIMEYTPISGLDNIIQSNELSHFHDIAREVEGGFLRELELTKESIPRYKLIIFCPSCSTDIRDGNMETYKAFFRMRQYVKKSGFDPINFILYDTPNFMHREHDTFVTSFYPTELFFVLELKEIIIPYSNKKIKDFKYTIDNSTSKLTIISNDLKESESSDDVKKIINNLDEMGNVIPSYHQELSKLRILNNGVRAFIQGKNNYFQIISSNNKTYEVLIKEQMGILESTIILLDSKINFFDAQYWNLKDSSLTKLSYQQQEDIFRRNIIVLVLLFVVSDILIKIYQKEIESIVKPVINRCINNLRINKILSFLKKHLTRLKES